MDKKTIMKLNVLAIICIMIFSFAIAPKTLQNDTFYTIKIGEHIMENGLDRVDPFSWHDLAYTYPHWLYDVSIYLIYSMRRNGRHIYIYYCFKLYIGSAFIYNK
ncbi:MAG: hypothetical protein HFJ54_07700 [Clostridia bacterium]|nr:hypothetical protein [Clostridia bacterium]